MKVKRKKNILRLVLVLGVVVAAVGLSACGKSAFDHRTNLKHVSETMLSNGGEEYFNAGNVTYQVEISRQLNPFNAEDVQYLAGINDAQSLPGNELWFAVFLVAKNQTNSNQVTSDTFKLRTSDGTTYTPTKLNSSVDPYAWTQQTLSPDGVEPGADSTAAYGPTQGGEVLFKVSDAIYSNRPLTLDIYAPGQTTNPSTVSLDL